MAWTFLDAVRQTMEDNVFKDDPAIVLRNRTWDLVDYFYGPGMVPMDGGIDQKFSIVYRAVDTTVFQPPGQARSTSTTPFTTRAQLTPVHWYYSSMHFEHELNVNDGENQIIDVLRQRQRAHLLGHLENMEGDATTEGKLWLVGGTSTVDGGETPHGVGYHFPPITSTQVATGATACNGAFQGTYGYGMTAWQGLTVTESRFGSGLKTYNAHWKSTTAAGVKLTETNILRLSRMFRHMHFQAPAMIGDIKLPAFAKQRLVTDEFILDQIGLAARSQNENLGANVLKYLGSDNTALVNGFPVKWAQTLDITNANERGYHPLYMLMLEPRGLVMVGRRKKWNLHRKPIIPDAIPDAIQEYTDFEGQTRVFDRQKSGAMISWVTSEA